MEWKERMCGLWRILFLIHVMDCHSLPKDASVSFKFGQPHQLYTDQPGRPLDQTDFRRAMNMERGGDENLSAGKEDPIEMAGHFQGDIILSDVEEYYRLKARSDSEYGLRNAITDLEKRWPRGEIPYLISAVFDKKERAMIANAVSVIHNSTCIRFVPRKREEDYIHILKADGCSSSVGRIGGAQTVSLGTGCFYNLGIIMHELMHTTGFWHEHSRADRDEHIEVIWSNIQDGMKNNFEKYDWTTIQSLGVDYDLGSIMHYGPYAFAKDRTKPTIIPLKRIEIGQRRNFSSKDIRKMKVLYNCPGSSPPDIPCEDENDYCVAWAVLGECEKNPKWMKSFCRKSCKQCRSEGTCDDMHVHCASWAKAGECQSNPKYMLIYCQRSCGSCL